ncbi:MAG: methylmalonyl Co-A mutase-associated GTPase MeaB, partial [Polaribacter sp.]
MNRKPSTLKEKGGIFQPKTTNKTAASKIKISRSKQNSVDEFVAKILKGNITFLSKAITLVESTNAKHQQKANAILERCLPHANNSIRIGIT